MRELPFFHHHISVSTEIELYQDVHPAYDYEESIDKPDLFGIFQKQLQA